MGTVVTALWPGAWQRHRGLDIPLACLASRWHVGRASVCLSRGEPCQPSRLATEAAPKTDMMRRNRRTSASGIRSGVVATESDWNETAVSRASNTLHLEKRRVDDALALLRHALVEYLAAVPRTSRTAYGSADLQALLRAFLDRFVEFMLPNRVNRVRNLAFAAKDARNDVAHYVGVMEADDALRHLSNIRQLLKDLGATSALNEVSRLYQAQLDSIRPREGAPSVAQVSEDSSRIGPHETLSLARSGGGEEGGPPAISGGLLYFEGDDTAYLGWVASNPEGYVVNVRLDSGTTLDYEIGRREYVDAVRLCSGQGAARRRARTPR